MHGDTRTNVAAVGDLTNKSEVGTALDAQDNEIDALHATIDMLEAGLTAVLAPSVPEAAKETALSVPRESPLGGKIDAATSRVAGARVRVNDLVHRLRL